MHRRGASRFSVSVHPSSVLCFRDAAKRFRMVPVSAGNTCKNGGGPNRYASARSGGAAEKGMRQTALAELLQSGAFRIRNHYGSRTQPHEAENLRTVRLCGSAGRLPHTFLIKEEKRGPARPQQRPQPSLPLKKPEVYACFFLAAKKPPEFRGNYGGHFLRIARRNHLIDSFVRVIVHHNHEATRFKEHLNGHSHDPNTA